MHLQLYTFTVHRITTLNNQLRGPWSRVNTSGGRAFIAEQRLRHVYAGGNVPDVHTEALTGREETCRWKSAAAGGSGDRVLDSVIGARQVSITYA